MFNSNGTSLLYLLKMLHNRTDEGATSLGCHTTTCFAHRPPLTIIPVAVLFKSMLQQEDRERKECHSVEISTGTFLLVKLLCGKAVKSSTEKPSHSQRDACLGSSELMVGST